LNSDVPQARSAGAPRDSAYRGANAPRSGLVLELAELFLIPAEHRHGDLVVFEELMTSLYADAPAAERGRVAELLASRPDLPPAIAAMIANDAIDIARPVLAASPALQTIDRIRIVAKRGEAHRQVLAGRPDLEEAVISALLLHGGPETVAALGANRALPLSPTQIDRLVDRAVDGGQPVCDLPQRFDLGAARRIDLFFVLAAADRHQALTAFDAETAFRRIEKRGRRTPPAVRPGLQRQLVDAVFSGDTQTYVNLLSEALGITTTLAQRIVGDPGGEPLIVALLAAGLDATDATSILVRSDPGLGWTYHTIRDLIRLYERIGWRTAEAVLERWSATGGDRAMRTLGQAGALRQTIDTDRQAGGDRKQVLGASQIDIRRDRATRPAG